MATGEALEPAFHTASEAEVGRACRLAAEAFEIYRTKSGAERGAFLRKIAEKLDGAKDALTERGPLESAYAPGRIGMEIGRAASQMRFFAGLVEEGSWVDARIDRSDPERKPAPKPDVRSMLTGELGSVRDDSPLTQSLVGMRTACRKFMDRAPHPARTDVPMWGTEGGELMAALGELRGVEIGSTWDPALRPPSHTARHRS